MPRKKPPAAVPGAAKVRVKLVPEEVAKAIARGAAAIDSAQLLNALIDCWGGPSRFAKDIFAEYQNARSGTLTRQRILEMLTRLTVQVTSQEIAKPKSATDMTDAELVVAAQSLLEKIHGPAPAGPAPPGPTRSTPLAPAPAPAAD